MLRCVLLCVIVVVDVVVLGFCLSGLSLFLWVVVVFSCLFANVRVCVCVWLFVCVCLRGWLCVLLDASWRLFECLVVRLCVCVFGCSFGMVSID